MLAIRSNSIFFIIIFLLFSGCSKDELALPARVDFGFELIAYEDGGKNKSNPIIPGPSDKIGINSGTLIIESLAFNGRRDEGRDVFFNSNFTGSVLIDLETGISSEQIRFDIPQGIYNFIELDINIGSSDEVSLTLEGTLKKGILIDIPVRFEYSLGEQIRVRAKPGKNAEKIVLKKDDPATARIIVDAGSMFRFVNMGMLINADLSILGGQSIILINKEQNIDIFNLMATRLENSFSVIFD